MLVKGATDGTKHDLNIDNATQLYSPEDSFISTHSEVYGQIKHFYTSHAVW